MTITDNEGTYTIILNENAKGLVITFTVKADGSNYIMSLYNVEDDAAIYTLQGIRVDKNKLTKGIYIINGKKVMLR